MSKIDLHTEINDMFESRVEVGKQYESWFKQVNREASILAREFDRKKQAFVSARAGSVKSGTLDVARLSEYKTCEDIFSRTKTIPQGKNHKFYVTLDWSGSMSGMAKEAMIQTVTQAAFLRKLKIGHYITMFGYPDHDNRNTLQNENEKLAEGTVQQHNTDMIELFSDDMNSLEYSIANKLCFIISNYVGYGQANYDIKDYINDNSSYNHDTGKEEGTLLARAVRKCAMGGTPLNIHLCEMRNKMLKDHRADPSVQQNLLVISDGASCELETAGGWRSDEGFAKSSLRFQADGKTITFPKTLLGSGLNSSSMETYGIMSTFNWGVNKMFLFLTDAAERWQVSSLMGSYMYATHVEDEMKEIIAGKILNIKNLYGCIDSVIYVATGSNSRRGGVSSTKLLEDGATAGKIKQAMKKEAMANPMQYLSAVLADAAAVNYNLNKHAKTSKQNARIISKSFDDAYWKRMVAFLEADEVA